MNRKNRSSLVDRVTSAAEASLTAHDYVSPIDVLVGIRWLDPGAVERWRRGQIDCLYAAIQTNPARVAEAMPIFRSWATGKGLSASETQYVARTPRREALRFSQDGDPTMELLYRTHRVSPALSGKQRERLEAKTSRAPDLVVIEPLNRDWKCHRCGGTGGLLMMETPGPACLRCVGPDDLGFLPSGDALLTRRVKAKSARYAVVVRFSRARRRYERQGVLAEMQALDSAEREFEAQRSA